MSKAAAATARGLGSPRQLGCPAPPHPPHRTRYHHHHQAPAAARPAQPSSLLASGTRHLLSRSAVATDGSPVNGPRGSSPRPCAPAPALGRLPCTAHPRKSSLSPVAGSYTYGNPQLSLSIFAGRVAQLQTRAASWGSAAASPAAAAGDRTSSSLSSGDRNASSDRSSSSPSPSQASASDSSAVAAARLLRGALEAALLPRLEALEGRIVEAVERRIVEAVERRVVQRLMDMEQQREDKMGARERQLTAALEGRIVEAVEGKVVNRVGFMRGEILKKVGALEVKILDRVGRQEQRFTAMAAAHAQRTQEVVQEMVKVRRRAREGARGHGTGDAQGTLWEEGYDMSLLHSPDTGRALKLLHGCLLACSHVQPLNSTCSTATPVCMHVDGNSLLVTRKG